MLTIPLPLPYRLLDPKAVAPLKATPDSAAFDLVSYEPYFLPARTVTLINLGFAMAIPVGYAGLILPRSSLASREKLRPVNTPGLIDPDYRGEIKVALENFGHKPQNINIGTRVAQLLIVSAPEMNFLEVEDLSETIRGIGGFGSTGRGEEETS